MYALEWVRIFLYLICAYTLCLYLCLCLYYGYVHEYFFEGAHAQFYFIPKLGQGGRGQSIHN